MLKLMIYLIIGLGSSLSLAATGQVQFVDGQCIDETGVAIFQDALPPVSVQELLANPELGPCLNLAKLDLSGLDLSQRDFSGTYFRNANLNSSNLSYGIFFRTVFWTTQIKDADFTNSVLEETSLNYQDFKNVNFQNAQLIDLQDFYAAFTSCNFDGARLSDFGDYALWLNNEFANADLREMTSNETTQFTESKFDRSTLLPIVFGNSVEARRQHAVTVKQMIFAE